MIVKRVGVRSFTVFCFGAATFNLEVQKIKGLGLVRSKFGHNYRRQGTYRRSSIPPPPLRCHGGRCQWLNIWSDLSFLRSLMMEPNLPAQKGAFPGTSVYCQSIQTA